jgi:hypothetical protein
MSNKTNDFKYNFLVHIFNGTAITNFNTTGGTTTLWIGLHTADPTDAGSTAAEGGYTAYTRASSQRAVAAGWTVTSGTSVAASVSPTAALSFPQVATTTTGTFSYFSVYPSSSATASAAIYNGAISPVINWSQNTTPSITTGSSITED